MKVRAAPRHQKEGITGQGGHRALREEILVGVVHKEVVLRVGVCTVLESVLQC